MDAITFRNRENLIKNDLFAILDIETTGFSPKHGEKILEIAIITVDYNGNEIDRYETLINPHREVSATHIHGITAGMVKNAPSIDMIIGDIGYHLQNKTIVGHNIAFDLSFINHELERYFKIHDRICGICTLKLSKIVEPDLSIRKLDTLCSYYNIENKTSHSAVSDCNATSELFTILKNKFIDNKGEDQFNNFLNPLRLDVDFKCSNISYKRANAIETYKNESNQFNNFLNRLSSSPSDEVPIQEYLNLLDDILADRLITQNELKTLSDLSIEYKISQSQATEIHQEYVTKLVRIYLIDNILTQCEINDLNKVCEILSIPNEILDNIIKHEKVSIHKQAITTNKLNYEGKSVCFTGQLGSKLNGYLIDRAKAQQLAMERGMIINEKYNQTAPPNTLQ